MFQKKNLLALALCLSTILALTMTGCSKKSASADPSASPSGTVGDGQYNAGANGNVQNTATPDVSHTPDQNQNNTGTSTNRPDSALGDVANGVGNAVDDVVDGTRNAVDRMTR